VEKGGLAEALTDAGVTAAAGLAWADEMRLGLRGLVRRVWAPRGVKVRQRQVLTYVWRYLALAVNGLSGTLHWTWTTSMKKEAIAPVVATWQAAGLQALVWDGAASHRAKLVREVGLPLITQPPAAPELNPAERVFEELRRAIEGRSYPDIEAKMAVVERELAALAADPVRLRRLTGWAWIETALTPFMVNSK
jgi:DDE superfamily endonuclease